jgi:nitrite reductase/ring-hydroxylating ferredoxin subunit
LVQLRERIPVVVVCLREGVFRALYARCPHRAGPMQFGQVRHRVVSDGPGTYSIDQSRHELYCPWHGMRFDVDDGTCPADPDRYRIRTYDVKVEADGTLAIEV